ncbi:MAG: L-lactate dehydrogenase, partial [Clostridia bacterium]|nr:L-lactate dehydrogenase [Clostridia bacterium]
VSTLLSGQYGQTGVYASVPAVLNRSGVAEVIELRLTEQEQALFNASCHTLDENYRLALTL